MIHFYINLGHSEEEQPIFTEMSIKKESVEFKYLN